MSRYIDADKLKKAWYTKHNITEEDCGACFVGYSELPRLIDNAPTADVRENVKGEWIVHELGGHHHKTILCGHDCSICGNWIVVGKEKIKEYNYCPNCGAEMRGDNHD